MAGDNLAAGALGGDAGAGKPLRELVEGIPGWGFGAWPTARILHARLDSRLVRPGELFVAVPGARRRGDDFVADAAARGAAAVLVGEEAARRVAAEAVLPGYAVADPRAALAQIADRLYDHAAGALTLTGVTGTNGKTTVVYMLAKIFQACGIAHGFWSTAQVVGGFTRFRPLMTTPEAPDLHRFLWEVARQGGRHAVLEVSSHAVVLQRIAGLAFRAVAVTNLSPDHLDFHGSVEAYAAAKRALVEGLAPDAVAVLNADDPWVAAFAGATRARVRTYGVAAGAVRAQAMVADPQGTTFVMAAADAPASGVTVRVPLWGRHNVYNALAALLLAEAHGIPAPTAAAALADFSPPVRRLETTRVGPFTLVNDVAMNRGSYDAVMRAMAELGRPLVVVNAIRGNRGSAINREIAETLAVWDRLLHFAPLVVSVSRSELERLAVDYRVRDEELAAFLEAAARHRLAVHCHHELADAIAEGVARVPPGGILLLLGTFGMDNGPRLAVDGLRQRAG